MIKFFMSEKFSKGFYIFYRNVFPFIMGVVIIVMVFFDVGKDFTQNQYLSLGIAIILILLPRFDKIQFGNATFESFSDKVVESKIEEKRFEFSKSINDENSVKNLKNDIKNLKTQGVNESDKNVVDSGLLLLQENINIEILLRNFYEKIYKCQENTIGFGMLLKSYTVYTHDDFTYETIMKILPAINDIRHGISAINQETIEDAIKKFKLVKNVIELNINNHKYLESLRK
ncbi:MAG: hypothetical protein RR500_08760, partial [Bacilli bacterium]